VKKLRAHERITVQVPIDLIEQLSVSNSIGGLRPFTDQQVYHRKQMSDTIKTKPITGDLKKLGPVTLKLAREQILESLWGHLVSRYHYLSYRKLLGHHLKYLAFIKEQPVAALSWSAPALKLRVRDCFIGWSDEQRKTYLNRIANNSRFLILPWVKVFNLSSHVLSLGIERIKTDWPQYFNTELLLLETFVDPRFFNATSYKAANWKPIGQTLGYTKKGKGYIYHGDVKDVFVYVLNPKFRRIIDCQQKPCDPFHRPPHSQKKVEDLQMLLKHCQWHPDLVPDMDLTEEDLALLSDELVAFHEQFHHCLGRIEHQRLGLAYMSGLLSDIKGKSVEPIALEFLDSSGVRPLQRFMKNYRWNHEAMEVSHQTILSEMISSPDGMINVDSSEFGKKGKESVGVARQYCGATGKVDNCQSGVFVGYSSEKGYGLLTCRLYMPEIWFTDEYAKRRKDNWVPEDLVFQTKLEIALDLIKKTVDSNLFPAKWIGCDATFGADLDFLQSLPQSLYYFAGIRSNTQVFVEKPKVGLPPYKGRGPYPKKLCVLPGEPQAQTVAKLARSEKITWKPVVLAEGSKGPITAKVARIRVYVSRDGLPEEKPQWLFIRQNSDGQLKYALSNAPEDIAFSQLCMASTMRWPIEQCFKEGKDQIGMDHYEHRSWPAWHRHMIYVFLALHFLLRLRLRFKKKPLA
jgi:SRSO17 transposase